MDSSNRYKDRRSSQDATDVPSLYTIFYGEVAALQPYGAFIKIPGFRKQGLVHKSQMSKARVEDPAEMLAVGEKVYCKVVSIEGDKIGLSMKVVNQTTGKDEDKENVQLSLDERKKRKDFKMEKPKIELGAVFDTTCKKCGGRGHLAQDCFHTKGGKVYDLIPDTDLTVPTQDTEESSSRKRKKKEKKSKKSKKHRHNESNSDGEHKKSKKHHHKDSDSDSDEKKLKKKKKHKHHHHHKKRRHSHHSTSSSEG